MPGEGNFYPLGQETFPAPLPAPGERCPPSLGAHPGTKTVLLLPGSLGSL